MRIVSLLASGTALVWALGQGAQLVGRWNECDDPPWVTSIADPNERVVAMRGANSKVGGGNRAPLRRQYLVESERGT